MVNKISGVYSYAFGKTPFLLAVRQGRKEILPLLIANGANLNAKDEKGETPLCNAIGGRSWYDKTPEEKATNDANDMEIVMLLIKNGADVKKANKDGTLLHYVAARGWYEVAELLIAKGANVNARYYKGEGRIYDGYTALHFAAENGHTDIVKLLITNGANVNAKEGSGETPLCIAASKGYRNIAEFLIAKGADVNAKGLYFYTRFHSCIEAPTVLHYAVDGNNIEIVKLLIANGANVNAKAKDGITPLRLVTPNGPREIIDLLKKHGAVE